MSTSQRQVRRTGAQSISRRTVVKGAAWATPAITFAAAAPAAAASLPPCVGGITGVAQSGWSVGATFPGCGQGSHFDVSIRITVQACQAQSICLRVYDLGHQDDGAGLRSRLWWAEAADPAPPYLFIEKCVQVPEQESVPVPFAGPGDNVRGQQDFLSANSTSVGNIEVAGGTNDGIHVNPCYFGGAGSSGRVAKFYYRLGNADAWLPGGYINANRPA
jgi:hypothetical protein